MQYSFVAMTPIGYLNQQRGSRKERRVSPQDMWLKHRKGHVFTFANFIDWLAIKQIAVSLSARFVSNVEGVLMTCIDKVLTRHVQKGGGGPFSNVFKSAPLKQIAMIL